MKATELQIGDWIWLSDDIYVKVEQITKRKIGFHFEGNESKMHYARLCDIDRVPITPEILENNGLEKIIGTCDYEWENNDNSWKHGYIHCVESADCFNFQIFSPLGWSMESEVNINYVHELQHVLRLCKIDNEIKL